MASRQTKVLGGSLAQTQEFTLDPGLFQYVQSVLVQIDNTAGPDITPTLTVATVNGTPIADKTQGSVIPAGDTGRATWALRLTDEGAGGGGLSLLGNAKYSEVGRSVNNVTTIHWNWTLVDGAELFDVTAPQVPVIITEGLYVFTAFVFQSVAIVAGKHVYTQLKAVDGVSGNDKFVSQITGYVDDSALVPAQTTKPNGFAAWLSPGDFLRTNFQHDEGAAKLWTWSCWVQLLG